MNEHQNQLWSEVVAIKRRVLESIGTELPYHLRYSQVYQTYSDFCEDAQIAYGDGLLTEGVVDLLEEHANRLIDFAQRVPA